MARTHLSRTLRVAGVGLALAASLTLAGCGFDAQTLQSYPPARGINIDVADGPKVRDLLIIANSAGQGRLSASLLSPGRADTLTGVEVTVGATPGATASRTPSPAPTAPGTPAESPVPTSQPTAAPAVSVPLPADKLVVLTGTGAPVVAVNAPGLKPGFTANVKLMFGSGAITEAVVPVVDVSDPIFTTAAPELH